MPRGGRRPGAGRKPAGEGKPSVKRPSPSKAVSIAREEIGAEIRVREAAGLKLRAIDVMEDNMLWAQQKADDYLRAMQKAAEGQEFPVAIDWFNESRRLRAFGQKCAGDLAPYQDPKLVAQVPAPPPEPEMKDITPGSAEERDHLAHLTQRFSKFAVVEGGQQKKSG